MNSNNQIESEKLLYKLILQFANYTHGSNSLLDPQLLNISNNLKQGASFHELGYELKALSKMLTYISPFENKVFDVANPSDQAQQKYFISRLNKLLVESNIPLKFQSQCTLLKQRSKGDLNGKAYKKVVDLALSLLLNIKNHAKNEQLDIESFLSDISIQLNSLEKYTLYVKNSNDQSIEIRGNLSDAIDLQVDQIKHRTAEAKELDSLQQNIKQHLNDLSTQFHKHKETEDERQHNTQNQINLMSEKLEDMEVEADTLRNNLKVAHDIALRDALTGLPNRLAYDERTALEHCRWLRYKSPLTLVIWDIDLFKRINDDFGHKAGDKTLTLVAQLIFNNCRETDFIARFGGEEFVMLLPNTDSEQALGLAETIRSIIAESGFNHNGQSIELTISCGISQFSEGDDHEIVFERADQALYQSKEQGRNKCSIFNH
jgi:diguanylate cyclase